MCTLVRYQISLSRFKLAGPPTPRDTEASNAYAIIHASLDPVCICSLIGINSNDFKLTRETIESRAVERPDATADAPQGRGLDKGDDDDEVRDLLDACGCTAHIRARGEEAQALKHEAGCKARRWVVERTHSWLNRFRRVLIRWEKKADNYLAFLHFACALFAFRAAGLFG